MTPEEGKTLRDYITEYQYRAKNNQVHQFAVALGLDEEKLRNMINLKLTEENINEFGNKNIKLNRRNKSGCSIKNEIGGKK